MKKRKRASITVFVSPCKNPKAARVSLYRGRARVGSAHLGRACTIAFHPRISRRSNFRAKLAGEETYEAGVSRRLVIRINHHRGKKK